MFFDIDGRGSEIYPTGFFLILVLTRTICKFFFIVFDLIRPKLSIQIYIYIIIFKNQMIISFLCSLCSLDDS